MKILVVFLCLLMSGCAISSEERYVFTAPLMFTQFDVVVYSSSSRKKVEVEVKKVWDEIEYWFKVLSPAGDSVAAQLNRDGFLSEETDPKAFNTISNFIVLSKEINRQSNGVFDLTVYPLIRLWGFYKQDEEHRVPSDAEIQDVLKVIGMDKVIFEDGKIRLKDGARLDYGAIAKGFAVDRGVEILKASPIISAGIVNAGGNLKVFGSKPDGTPWSVGVRDPNGGNPQEVVPMYDGEAIATSGDYEQFFVDENGEIYHHIFNPKTGRPVKHNLASISVIIKDSAEQADIFSTTLLALGREEALKMIDKLNLTDKISLYFIERNGDLLTNYANSNWIERVQNATNSADIKRISK
ncbi:MAG: FAD:protein FMN transferase [Brevinema sp.]